MEPRLARHLVIGTLAAAIVVSGGYVAITYHPAPSATGPIVLATSFPIFDFARNIAGGRLNVSLLVPMTLDVHDFEPTPSSVAAVASASLLLYNGAGLEPWVPGLIGAAENGHLVAVDSSAGIATLPVPVGFQKDNRSVDPHVWLDPILAKHQVGNILAGLIEIDPANASYFTANADTYDQKLDALDRAATNLSESPATRTFVTFHEAFAYFAERYHLTQVPIAGPFEEDPTPSDIQNVVDAIHANRLCYVGYESLSNPVIAQTIATETNASLVLMDPIEGLSAQDELAGQTYLTKMQSDLSSFSLALNHVGCS